MSMLLLDYIADTDRRKKLAEATESNPDYLWQVATGRRRASTGLAKRIHEKTFGLIRLETLRPDVWEGEASNG